MNIRKKIERLRYRQQEIIRLFDLQRTEIFKIGRRIM